MNIEFQEVHSEQKW